jgi:sortase A
VERVAWALGLLLVVAYGAARVHSTVLTQQDLERFEQARREAVAAADPVGSALPLPGRTDYSLWSPGRIEKHERSLDRELPPPLAVLSIPRIRLEVPVLDGTDDFTLNRAVGLIESTARPGEPGNIGIAGHRDGFFRGLKNVERGDVIKLVTLRRTETYIVEATMIVGPGAVEVLDTTPEPSLTLITCYPFYYFGSAPQRYVVRAVRTSAEPDAQVHSKEV